MTPLSDPACLRGGILSGTPGAWRLCRFPSGCEALGSGYMADCAAGIRILFRTDARKITIRGRILDPKYHDGRAAWNALVDCGPLLTFDMPRLEAGADFSFGFDLPESAEGHRVEIFPTSHLPVEISLFEAADATFVKPCPPPQKDGLILFLGDSITQGFFSDPACSWSSRVAAVLNTGYLNLAIGGAFMPNGLPEKLSGIAWTRCFVAYGVNDASQNLDPDYFRNNAEKTLCDLARFRPGQPVELISPIYWPDAVLMEKEDLLAHFRLILRDIAAHHPEVRFHPGESLMPEDRSLFFDGVHPNNEGMKIYAESLLKQL